MHSDNHRLLHACRAAELQRDAVEFTLARAALRRRGGWTVIELRRRVGWTMIELGLRLAQTGPAPARAARTV